MSAADPFADEARHFVRSGPRVDERTISQALDVIDARRVMGASQLAGSFRGSRGFGVTFRDDTLPLALERHPFIGHLTDALPPVSPFAPDSGRKVNAYYVNVLWLDGDQTVGPHIDGTLSDLGDAFAGVTPDVVSVLYLAADGACGPLILSREGHDVARVFPDAGQVVHFRGDLVHEVRPGASTARRVSIVAEQYVFPPALIAQTPALRVHTLAPPPIFGATGGSRSTQKGRFSELLGRVRKTGAGPSGQSQ